MSVHGTISSGYSASVPADRFLLLRERLTPQDGSRRGVILVHGHGGDASTFAPSGYNVGLFGMGYHAWQLAEAGPIVVSIDAGGPTSWGGPNAQSALTDAYAKLTTPVSSGGWGAKPGPVGLMSHSMGALTCFNWIKNNYSKVGAYWAWEPTTDLDWAYSTAGYNPDYGLANQSSWTTEINASYGSYAATAGSRVHDEPSTWSSLPFKTVITHAKDDSVVPQKQSLEFVAAVNSPNLALRQPWPTGDHNGVFQFVDPTEVANFFARNL